MIRDLAKDLAKYAPSQAVPALIGLLAVPILTRIIQPVDYGNYILVISTISVLSIIVGWLGTSLIRFYPVYERDGRLDELYDAIVGWLLITVTGLAIIYVGSLFFAKATIGSQLYSLMLIGSLIFVLTSIFEVLLSVLRARRLAGSYTLFSSWRTVVGLGIGLVLVLRFEFGVDGLLWGSAASLVVVLPLLWRHAIGRVPKINGLSIDLTKEMARYGFPLVVGNLAAWILSLSDRYILEIFRGAHDVGIYSASYAISEKSIFLLSSLFMLASGPIGMTLWEKEGAQSARYFVSSVTRYYLLLCVPAAIGLSVLAQPITGVLVGAEYREGYRIIPFVALAALVLGLQQRFQTGLVFYKMTIFIMIAIIIAGLINVGLNMVFIPLYGYMAAAITTLISYIILLIVMIILSRRYFVWTFPFRSLVRVTLAASVMGLAIYPLGNYLTSCALINVILGIFVGVIIYSIMLLFLQELRNDEIQLLRSLVAKIFYRRI